MLLIIYAAVLCITMMVTILLGAFTLVHCESKKRFWYVAVLLSIFFLLLGTLLGITANSRGGAFAGTKVEYIGSAFLAPLSLFFIAAYCEFNIRKTIKAIMLCLPLVIIALLWTTESHGLIYYSFEFAYDSLTGLFIVPGPLHLLIYIFTVICLCVSFAMLTHRYIKWDSKYRKNIKFLFAATFAPAGVSIIHMLNIEALNETGIHLLPVTMSITSIILWVNIVRYDLLDIVPKAMEMALQSIKEAYILVGTKNEFLHANESAKRIFPKLEDMKKDGHVDQIENWPLKLPENENTSAPVNFKMPGNRYYVANISMISDRNAKILGKIILIQDVTETVLAANRAEEANKSKSHFLAAMSHEIRTPMNAILGIAQIQLQSENLSNESKLALERIFSSSSILLGIVNDILDLSKIETGKMEIIPVEYYLPSLIHDTTQMNVVRIGSKPVKFILDIDEKLPSRLIGDDLRIKQILNNLISNAIKYCEKGYVKLSVKHSSFGGSIILCFIVEDTGQGIKSEDKERLFSEYTRFNIDVNRMIEGAGIGLNITKNLVELMEGTIKVESEYGKGSIFTVTVKQKAVECEAIGAELSQQLMNFSFINEKQQPKLQIAHKYMPHVKVLVVDDIDINLYVAEGLMSPYGLKVETAANGFEAIQKVEGGETYDVIFMDQMMPGMDGIETTKRLRDSGYTRPIVALTANALVGQAEIFLKNGFDDFISKPIDITKLDRILMQWVSKEK